MSLSIDQISKTYPNGVKALDGLSLSIAPGMFGLLGPNGAGKSSLMRSIATLQSVDKGTIHFNELDILNQPMELRKILGYLPQDFGVYSNESAESMLDYFAILKGIFSKKERNFIVDKVLELTNLHEVRRKHVSGYSGGMKRRFGIAQILLNDPKLIIVDEPTAGLDPAERTRFLNIIRGISTTSTVILSTHIVADIKELCQDMAIINKGSVIQHETPENSIKLLRGLIWTTEIQPNQLSLFENSLQVLSSAYNADNSLTIRVYADKQPLPSNLYQVSWTAATPDLSDVYFHALHKDLNHV